MSVMTSLSLAKLKKNMILHYTTHGTSYTKVVSRLVQTNVNSTKNKKLNSLVISSQEMKYHLIPTR